VFALSKKKIFALICLFVFTSWVLVSLYYYNKHVVTVTKYKVGERIEVAGGIVIIHNVEIHDFKPGHFDMVDGLEWFYSSVLPKLPDKLQSPAYKMVSFYSDQYYIDIGAYNVEGRIIYLNGIFGSNNEKDLFVNDNLRIEANVLLENGRYLTNSGGGHGGYVESNYRLFNSRGKFFLNEYTPANDDNLIITVKDELSNETHELTIKPVWETNKYNFFNRPPAQYSFCPDKTVSRFVRAVLYHEDLSTAKEIIHPQIIDFPWENLEYDEWSRSGPTQYLDRYLEFDDVFSTRTAFSRSDDEGTVFEQVIYKVYYNGEWKIIDVSPPKSE